MKDLLAGKGISLLDIKRGNEDDAASSSQGVVKILALYFLRALTGESNRPIAQRGEGHSGK